MAPMPFQWLQRVPSPQSNRAGGTAAWVSRLWGHLRTQGYEDADGDSLKPLLCIHLAVVDWKLRYPQVVREVRLGAVAIPAGALLITNY